MTTVCHLPLYCLSTPTLLCPALSVFESASGPFAHVTVEGLPGTLPEGVSLGSQALVSLVPRQDCGWVLSGQLPSEPHWQLGGAWLGIKPTLGISSNFSVPQKGPYPLCLVEGLFPAGHPWALSLHPINSSCYPYLIFHILWSSLYPW